jgi:hypothetical protein
MRAIAPRIHRLPLDERTKATMAGSVLLGGALYGCEIDYLGQRQLELARRSVSMAIWGKGHGRNRTASLLMLRDGRCDPYVHRARTICRFWRKLVHRGVWQELECDRLWQTPRGKKPDGPVAMFRQLLDELGVSSVDGRDWEVDGRDAAIPLLADFDGTVLRRAPDHMWRKLAATRHNFEGLEAGRDDVLSDGRKKRLRDKLNRGRMRMIQADGVHTPWRQHQRAGGDGSCPRCGHDCGDWEHLAWDCPARVAEMNEDERTLPRADGATAGPPGASGPWATCRRAGARA